MDHGGKYVQIPPMQNGMQKRARVFQAFQQWKAVGMKKRMRKTMEAAMEAAMEGTYSQR
jgi:hypothetical protein